MNIQDIFWLGQKDLSEKLIRTALTVVMVVIGVASIIALVSQTQGISASVSSALSSLGPTSIILESGTSTGFTAAQVAQLSTLPNVSSVIPIVTGSVSAYANGQNISATIVGITPQGLQELIGNVSLYQGAMYQDTQTPSAVIGHSIAFPTSLGGSVQNVQVGQPVTAHLEGRNGATYTLPVTGIINSYGTSIIPVDTGIFISLQEAQLLLNKPSYSTVIVKATNTSSVTPLSNLLGDIYGTSVHITTTQQLLTTVNSIIGSISTLLAVVAGISLLVAAIGIMNIMLIAVYERTHEIGIMKSLGFKNKHVMMIFVMQALIIGVLGGVFGVLLGAGASYGLSAVLSHSSTSSTTASSTAAPTGGGSFRGGAGGGGGAAFVAGPGAAGASSSSSGFSSISYSPVFTPLTIAEALIVAITVSVLAGIYPAWRASRMQPIDALRQL